MPRIPTRVRIVLILHQAEENKTSSTGRLLSRILSTALVCLRGALDTVPLAPAAPGRRLLLFPSPGARALSARDTETSPAFLVVPDGTWAQARRACRREPWALGAEPVALAPGPPSRYGLRRTSVPGGLCTFEAVARALGILEDPAVERSMLRVLDEFVRRTWLVREGRVRA